MIQLLGAEHKCYRKNIDGEKLNKDFLNRGSSGIIDPV